LRVLILGLDTFARKNISQIISINEKNIFFDIITNDLKGNSKEVFGNLKEHNRLFISRGNYLQRLALLLSVLGSEKHHHVELYAAGRMTILYVPLLMMLNKKIIVVERGDIGLINEYSLATKIAIKCSLKRATLIWYKEPYMEKLFTGLTQRPLFFLPNAAPKHEDNNRYHYNDKKIDFLWVNRLIPQRRSDWIVDCLKSPELISSKAAFLGFQAEVNTEVTAMQDYVRSMSSNNIECLNFIDPYEYYKMARFFVLPTKIVFGNNSLLEAMSYGVVPIVSASESTELIVEDGINGLIFDHTKKGLKMALIKAKEMSNDSWNTLSINALNTVLEKYSLGVWADLCNQMYSKVAQIG